MGPLAGASGYGFPPWALLSVDSQGDVGRSGIGIALAGFDEAQQFFGEGLVELRAEVAVAHEVAEVSRRRELVR